MDIEVCPIKIVGELVVRGARFKYTADVEGYIYNGKPSPGFDMTLYIDKSFYSLQGNQQIFQGLIAEVQGMAMGTLCRSIILGCGVRLMNAVPLDVV
ncbi:MAG: hypothetical protein AAB632_02395 [Patescibacteria group bacterium]